VAQVFQQAYGLSLAELRSLFVADCWRGGCGGEEWAVTCAAVEKLIQAVDKQEKAQVVELFAEIPRMSHNTGTVGRKLEALRRDDR
jgi:hypothetical protein